MSEKTKENIFINLLANIVAPWFILTKLSGPQALGPLGGLLLAISFPAFYGLYDFFQRKSYNPFSILGFTSALLTGLIGLMELDKTWMIIKETSIPLLFGLLAMGSMKTSWAIVPVFLGQAFRLDKIKEAFNDQGKSGRYGQFISFASVGLASSFFLSAILNFLLAYFTLEGRPGTVEFNKSLGTMTALSFPVIVAPMMAVTAFIFYRLFSIIKHETQLSFEDIFKDGPRGLSTSRSDKNSS